MNAKNLLLACGIVVGAAGVVSWLVLNNWFDKAPQRQRHPLAPSSVDGWPEPFADSRTFNPRPVVPPFSAITKIPTVNASDVSKKLLPSDLILGVTVNGESRAYPINYLTGPEREILNDRLGGKDIAATW